MQQLSLSIAVIGCIVWRNRVDLKKKKVCLWTWNVRQSVNYFTLSMNDLQRWLQDNSAFNPKAALHFVTQQTTSQSLEVDTSQIQT